MAAVVRRERRVESYFETFSCAEAGLEGLVRALRARVSKRINGSVLAALSEGRARVSCSEKDRSATNTFWREIVDELEAFLATAPALVARTSLGMPSGWGRQRGSYVFQVQWLTGRKANYWHQDVRWRTHWDAVLFAYVGDDPTPTDLACPDAPPARDTTPKEYVKRPHGQPEIHARTASGDLCLHRPAVETGGALFGVGSHVVRRRRHHRQSPRLAPNRALAQRR